MTIAFMLGCWAICLAAGRVIGGETHGPVLGAAMTVAWQLSMVFIALRLAIKESEVD